MQKKGSQTQPMLLQYACWLPSGSQEGGLQVQPAGSQTQPILLQYACWLPSGSQEGGLHVQLTVPQPTKVNADPLQETLRVARWFGTGARNRIPVPSEIETESFLFGVASRAAAAVVESARKHLHALTAHASKMRVVSRTSRATSLLWCHRRSGCYRAERIAVTGEPQRHNETNQNGKSSHIQSLSLRLRLQANRTHHTSTC